MGTYSYSGTPTKIVSAGGTYTIKGYGAQGGSNSFFGPTFTGGAGAEATGTFVLTPGEKLEIFVGGAGKNASGGGGGTFVLGEAVGASSYTPLLIAGGGGGANAGSNGG